MKYNDKYNNRCIFIKLLDFGSAYLCDHTWK